MQHSAIFIKLQITLIDLLRENIISKLPIQDFFHKTSQRACELCFIVDIFLKKNMSFYSQI